MTSLSSGPSYQLPMLYTSPWVSRETCSEPLQDCSQHSTLHRPQVSNWPSTILRPSTTETFRKLLHSVYTCPIWLPATIRWTTRPLFGWPPIVYIPLRCLLSILAIPSSPPVLLLEVWPKPRPTWSPKAYLAEPINMVICSPLYGRKCCPAMRLTCPATVNVPDAATKHHSPCLRSPLFLQHFV